MFGFAFPFKLSRTIFLIGGRFVLLLIRTISFLLLRRTEIEFVLPAQSLGVLFKVYHDNIVGVIRFEKS